jgi:hypothetical protein
MNANTSNTSQTLDKDIIKFTEFLPLYFNSYFKFQSHLIDPRKVNNDTMSQTSVNVLYKKLKHVNDAIDKCYINNKGQLLDHKTIGHILNLLDVSKPLTFQITKKYNAQNTNTTWLKIWEIIKYFKLIPPSLKGESFETFHNTISTDNTIFVNNHYIKANTNIKSHICNSTLNDIVTKSNADLTGLQYIKEIKSRFSDTIHLYISNYNMTNEYNPSETVYYNHMVSQILLGFYIMKKHANMIIKIYTFFDYCTQDIISYCSKFFNKLYIVRPSSTKITSNEIYLVGIGFCGIYIKNKLEDILLGKSTEILLSTTIPFDKILKSIYSPVIDTLNNVMNLYNIIDIDNKLKDIDTNVIEKIHNKVITKWLNINNINSLKKKYKLKQSVTT